MWCDDGCVMAKTSADHQRWLLLLGVVLLGNWVDFLMRFVCITISATIEPILINPCILVDLPTWKPSKINKSSREIYTLFVPGSFCGPILQAWRLGKKRECNHFPFDAGAALTFFIFAPRALGFGHILRVGRLDCELDWWSVVVSMWIYMSGLVVKEKQIAMFIWSFSGNIFPTNSCIPGREWATVRSWGIWSDLEHFLATSFWSHHGPYKGSINNNISLKETPFCWALSPGWKVMILPGGAPDPVINETITSLIGLATSVTHLFTRPFIGVIFTLLL